MRPSNQYCQWRPTAIYKGGSENRSFLGLPFNNIKVAFLWQFSFGVITSIGAAYSLGSKWVMPGSIHNFFFIPQDVLFIRHKQIGLHGTIEISVNHYCRCAG